jgi:hypothetical protein
MGLLLVDSLREELDEMATEDNPWRRWLEFSREKVREKKQGRLPRGLPGQGRA